METGKEVMKVLEQSTTIERPRCVGIFLLPRPIALSFGGVMVGWMPLAAKFNVVRDGAHRGKGKKAGG